VIYSVGKLQLPALPTFECTTLLYIYYLFRSERSEHWRRLRDWSFCPSFRVCVHVCVCTWWLVIISTCHTQADIRTGKTSWCLHTLLAVAVVVGVGVVVLVECRWSSSSGVARI